MNIPLSLYIHFPWCVTKCPYCDFNSYKLTDDVSKDKYIDALIFDLESELKNINNKKISSIFLGGGTPSLFSAKQMEKLFVFINEKLNLKENIEVTMEANPGTLEYQSFQDYKSIGINRISLGVQSFQEDKLKTLGRIHDSNDVLIAIDKIIKAGYKNFNIDLMYGLPGQHLDDSLYDLNEAIKLRPTHISWYNLTIEPNTYFCRKPPVLPAMNKIVEIEFQGKKLLKEKGFMQYEVSAYSKKGYQCNHNLNYWEFGDYIGIGAGAHGKISDKNIIRYQKLRFPKDYLKNQNKVFKKEFLLKEQLPFEYMLNSLRLKKPISKKEFEFRTGVSWLNVEHFLKKYSKRNDIFQETEKELQLTKLGRKFLNEAVEVFL